MAKITAEQLAIAEGWNVFGQRLGWILLECDEGKAKFGSDRVKVPFVIHIQTRQDIERTWRDREGQPKVQPVNVAKLGAG